MAQKDTKQRLFEVMEKLNPDFKNIGEMRVAKDVDSPFFTVGFQSYGYLEDSAPRTYDSYKFYNYQDALNGVMRYFKTVDAIILFKEKPDEIIEIAKQTPVKGEDKTRYTIVKTLTIKDYQNYLKFNPLSPEVIADYNDNHRGYDEDKL